jgi:dTDP-4-amino-4,6-dideoxygalactose transaminase
MIPVVVDVDERGLIDPAAAEAAIGPRTGGILAVHMTGILAPMTALRTMADRHGIVLVADGAHALGARTGDIQAGSLGDIEAFSIGATKQVAAGEGGCLTLRNENDVQRARLWALQGHAPGSMDASAMGMNLRLGELAAALALRQLEGLADQLDRRLAIHRRYETALSRLPLRLSGPIEGERSAFKDELVWVDDPSDRGPLRAHLAGSGVETRPYYDRAVPDLTAFVGRVHSVEHARHLASRSFAIPIHPRLSDDDVDRVIDGIGSFFDNRTGS